jgi:hypothetical protein
METSVFEKIFNFKIQLRIYYMMYSQYDIIF